MSQDPIRLSSGDTNPYRYVGNNATNSTDPSGQTALTEGAVTRNTHTARSAKKGSTLRTIKELGKCGARIFLATALVVGSANDDRVIAEFLARKTAQEIIDENKRICTPQRNRLLGI
jgi:uncharacterized protein RhaS with RHS repeats